MRSKKERRIRFGLLKSKPLRNKLEMKSRSIPSSEKTKPRRIFSIEFR